MKNHYVMDANSQMLHRDTLEGCRQWCQTRAQQFRSFGMKAPTFRIFYDTGTEPVETI